MCEAVLDGECAAKPMEIDSSNNMISRIDEISNYIKAQLLERPKNLFCNPTGWMYGHCQPSTIVDLRAIYWDGEIIEDFMFFYQIQRKTTGSDVFDVLCDFFHNQNCRGSDVWVYVPTGSSNDWQAPGACSSNQRKRTKHYYKRTAWFIAKCLLWNIWAISVWILVFMCQNCKLYQSSPTPVSECFWNFAMN